MGPDSFWSCSQISDYPDYPDYPDYSDYPDYPDFSDYPYYPEKFFQRVNYSSLFPLRVVVADTWVSDPQTSDKDGNVSRNQTLS